MKSVHAEVDVEAPLSTVYNQWTQFEEFPRFMEGVESVRQLDDAHLHWVAKIGHKQHEWDAVITEQVPDEVISWRSEDGKLNAGVVRFEPISEYRTKVKVDMSFEPEGVIENIGSWLGASDRRVEGDLERFCEMLQERTSETGAWRGSIEGGERVD